MWTAPNGTRYLVAAYSDFDYCGEMRISMIYFVDSETGEVDEERTLEGHEGVRIMIRIFVMFIEV